MSETILSIKDLKVNYGGIEAVKGISFDVEEGSIVTLIGANGAGKSSTLRTIAGLVKPSSGSIVFRGDDITGCDTFTQIVDKLPAGYGYANVTFGGTDALLVTDYTYDNLDGNMAAYNA